MQHNEHSSVSRMKENFKYGLTGRDWKPDYSSASEALHNRKSEETDMLNLQVGRQSFTLLPFLVAITSNTMQTLSATQQVLKTSKEQLSNAIKTYDEINRTYRMMENYYKAGSDGLQLKDIDLILGRGTSNALTGIFDNLSKGKGVKRENLVALRDSVEDAAFVNDRLLSTTQNFNDNLNKAEAIKKMYGDSNAKSAIELGNLYTKALLDLNIVEILQRHTDMEFKTESEKFALAESIRRENEFKKIDLELNQKLRKQPFSYKDPMRNI